VLERRVILNLGKSGFGKSYCQKTVLLPVESRAIVIDPKWEYGAAGCVNFTDFDSLADYCSTRQSFRAAWIGGIDFIDAVFHLSFALRDMAVIMEEADSIPCVGWYREAVYRGRQPEHITIHALAQRPHLLAPDIRSQVTDLYCFNNSEDSALVWLKSFFDNETINKIPDLPPKYGIHWSLTDTGPAVEDFRLP
jgi:hypothetical protein